MWDWLKTRTTTRTTRGGLVAAAANLSVDDVTRMRIKPATWQEQAWQFYETVPEVKYGTTWIANALSRAKLYAGKPDDDGQGEPVRLDSGPAVDALTRLHGGFSGQSEMLRRFGVHLTIAGETYLVGAESDGEEHWAVAAGSQLTKNAGHGLSIKFKDDTQPVPLGSDAFITRIWRPEGQDFLRPDSPIRSMMGVLAQLIELDAYVTAIAQSRLARGLLLLPKSVDNPRPGDSPGQSLDGDSFATSLQKIMATAVRDPASPARLVPNMATMDRDDITATKFLEMDTPFDEQVQVLREAAIKRIAVGMDIPQEILAGMGESGNHWTAWLISEDAVKLSIEPLLGLICDALTQQYLWPLLRLSNTPDPEQYVIWYDTSELVLRPNRSPEALEYFDRGLISSDAALREGGWSDEDAPSVEERESRFVQQLVLARPDLAEQLLPDLFGGAQLEATAPVQIPSSRPTGSPRAEIPAAASTSVVVAADPWSELEASGLLCAAELGAVRALEWVGSRLLSTSGRKYRGELHHHPKWELHCLFQTTPVQQDDLLDRAYVLLDEVMADTPCLKPVVDRYVRDLMSTQTKHSRDRLAAALVMSGCVSHA